MKRFLCLIILMILLCSVMVSPLNNALTQSALQNGGKSLVHGNKVELIQLQSGKYSIYTVGNNVRTYPTLNDAVKAFNAYSSDLGASDSVSVDQINKLGSVNLVGGESISGAGVSGINSGKATDGISNAQITPQPVTQQPKENEGSAEADNLELDINDFFSSPKPEEQSSGSDKVDENKDEAPASGETTNFPEPFKAYEGKDGYSYSESKNKGVYVLLKDGKKVAAYTKTKTSSLIVYYDSEGKDVAKSYNFDAKNNLVTEGTMSSDGIFVLTPVSDGEYQTDYQTYKSDNALYYEKDGVFYTDPKRTIKATNVPQKVKDIQSEISTRSTAQKYIGLLESAQGWSTFSSLFCKGDCFGGWSQQVDKIFHDAYLGSEYWSEAICKSQSGISEVGSALFTLSEDGFLIQSATIAATKQRIETPEGVQWLYKVSYYVRNPEATSKKESKSRGTQVTSSEELTSEEAELWNAIQTDVKTIGNKYAKSSRTSTGETITYNLEFRGGRTVELFEEVIEVDSGEESVKTNDDSFASYSDTDYSEVCLIFENKPTDAFYNEVSEICTEIEDVTETQPTTLDLADDQVESSSSDGVREI